MPNQQYLQRKHNTWQVVVEIPKHLRAAAGRSRFKRSLHTHSLDVADKLKYAIVAEFQKRINELSRQQGDPQAALIADALALNEELRTASRERPDDDHADAPNSQDLALEHIKDRARELEDEQGETAAALFFRTATGKATLLHGVLSKWLGELEGQAKGQTISQHRATVERLMARKAGWNGVSTIEEVTRRKAGDYVSHLIGASGLSRKTIKRHLSSLSQFWIWLQSRGLVNEDARNPWRGREVGKTKGIKSSRKGLVDTELVKLLSGAYSTERYRQILSDLVRLDLVCGARLDELCALERDDVERLRDGWWCHVREGKTEAAARSFPLHKSVAPIIERRLKDGGKFLFAELIEGGPDNKRSWYVSKAYGRFRKQVGVGGRWKDFHALRHTFTEAMEGAEVPESTVKLIIGHVRASMTFGNYSTGQRVELRKAIDKLNYSTDVMKLIRQSVSTTSTTKGKP